MVLKAKYRKLKRMTGGVCDDWAKFKPFYDWYMSKWYGRDVSLRKHDMSACGSPDNCYLVEYDGVKDHVYYISPDGVTHSTRNLTQFAKEYGLCPSGLSALKMGKTKAHRGWSLHPDHIDSEVPSKNRMIIDPWGAVRKIEKQKDFAEQWGFNATTLSSLVNGRIKSHRGWKMVKQ